MDKKEQSRRFHCMERRGKKRIFRFLKLQEQFSVYDFSEESPYTESILSREVKSYFAETALKEKEVVLSEQGDEGESFLQRLYSLFQLDAFEQMCIELAVLGEINPYFEKFYIYMNNDWNSGYLTLDTAIKLYTQDYGTNAPYYQYFRKESRLLSYFLFLERQEGKGRVRWGLKCREGFFQLLLSGQMGIYEEYPFIECSVLDTEKSWTYNSTDCYPKLDTVLSQNPSGIYLYGEEEDGQRKLLGEYGKENGHMVCFLDVKRLLFLLEKNLLNCALEEICRNIWLQVIVMDAWLCLHFIDEDYWEKEAARRLTIRMLELFMKKDSILFLLGEKPLGLARQYPELWEVSYENSDAQRNIMLWKDMAEHYSIEESSEIDIFADTYHFTPVQIERIFQNAQKRSILRKSDCIQREDIKEECIRETSSSGNNRITVMDTGYKWGDLVLPKQQKEQMKAACNRIRYKHWIYHIWGFDKKVAYGRGVSMIFSGPPGTGKTMSAGIIADYLGTSLYRVNLAAVVSKYIGETEKNLNAVFEAVKRGQGVLFFDEADVLFGRRTEVKDSNDKHSNMETAFLLQKMEEYEGIVILATNYIQNIDDAFKRRIQFFVEFPFPDVDCRRQLWKKVFPEQIEFEEVPDYEFLAVNFELSGSHIKNIAVQAAFFAADEKKGVNMEHIMKALQIEVRKMGKRISREDLHEYYIYFENN